MRASTKFYLLLLLTLQVFFPGPLYAQGIAITPAGEWGTGNYDDIYIRGNYAYCTATYAGLDILDISSPTSPFKVGSCDTQGLTTGVYVSGNYAYVTDSWEGLQIIEITMPTSPTLVGNYDTTSAGYSGAYCVAVRDGLAYVGTGSGLQIIDVANPDSPFKVGHYSDSFPDAVIQSIYLKDNYIYAIGAGSSLDIIDISNPVTPTQIGRYYYPPGTSFPAVMRYITVDGNYAYITYLQYDLDYIAISRLLIVDISTPAAPGLSSTYDLTVEPTKTYVSGKYAYAGTVNGMRIIDITEPTNPVGIGNYDTHGIYDLWVREEKAYTAGGNNGLGIVDVSEPAAPALRGNFDRSGSLADLQIAGNYAYMADSDGLRVLDIATPSPGQVGNYTTGQSIIAVAVDGNYACLVGTSPGQHGPAYSSTLNIVDITAPSAPTLAGRHDTYDYVNSIRNVNISGNYVYILHHGLEILDISNPSAPTPTGELEIKHGLYEMEISGNYAYIAAGTGGLQVINIADPTAPVFTAGYYTTPAARAISLEGQYVYLTNYEGFEIIDISNPENPTLAGFIDTPWIVKKIFVTGNRAYVTGSSGKVGVYDVSSPASPVLKAHYHTSGTPGSLIVKEDRIYIADGGSGKLVVLNVEPVTASPELRLNREELVFSANTSGATTGVQTVLISNSGGGTLAWTVETDESWLRSSPSMGTGSGELFITVDSMGLEEGIYTGTVTITDILAEGSPKTITVGMTVFGTNQAVEPFGEFSTPGEGAAVSGSIAVTGWVLDDIGVRSLQIYREEGSTLVYIGDALFVEGARPDVELAYPGFPGNHKSGWGYMLLTNFLPGGSGTFTLHAVATDVEGNRVTLGTRTIVVDNDNAVKPFGALDTPVQGGIVSGSEYISYGWALTPQPATIPIDGSTIRVWVDGVSIGNPEYNKYREDIAGAFPGYNNTDGAVGYFYLDTTQYENGVHTISWTVEDDAGNADGVGSRYFKITNPGTRNPVRTVALSMDASSGPLEGLPAGSPRAKGWHPLKPRYCFAKRLWDCGNEFALTSKPQPVCIKRGFGKNRELVKVSPDANGLIAIQIGQLEPLEIRFGNPAQVDFGDGIVVDKSISGPLRFIAFQRVGAQKRPLPVGSTFDEERGSFYWQPGPGFIGDYRLVFVWENKRGNRTNQEVMVKIGKQ
ncbi:MAG: hypothetical protein GY757_37935 [bacterium]|nr:hypothetical protein [bacterium]